MGLRGDYWRFTGRSTTSSSERSTIFYSQVFLLEDHYFQTLTKHGWRKEKKKNSNFLILFVVAFVGEKDKGRKKTLRNPLLARSSVGKGTRGVITRRKSGAALCR